MGTDHKHRICTYGEAEASIRKAETIYVNECFCRGPAKAGKTPWEYCGCPTETCMGFQEPKDAEGHYTFRAMAKDEALALFDAWREKGNLFRYMMDEDWVCFCCSCGCGWFRDKEGNRAKDSCDPSPFIEETDLSACTLCEDCVEVCAYEARAVADGALQVDRVSCYGCGACEYACPEGAITMVARE